MISIACICSGGSDYIVSLWRVASCSSAPWLSGDVTSGDTDLASRPYDPLAEDDADYNLSGGNDPADVKVLLSMSFVSAQQCFGWYIVSTGETH